MSTRRDEDFNFLSRPYAIIADGCSGTADSDIGARLLVKSAESLVGVVDRESAANRIISSAEISTRVIGCLSVDCLCATLLIARLISLEHDNDTLEVLVAGDGFVGARRRTGGWSVWHHQFPGSAFEMPYYLRYELDPALKQRYLSSQQHNLRVTRYDFDDQDVCYLAERKEHQPFGMIEQYLFPVAEYDIASIWTDGLASFAGPQGMVPLTDVLPHFFGFKNTLGAFVLRRAKKAFADMARAGWDHQDDLAWAVLYAGS